MPVPHWVAFDPDDESLRQDFEQAYLRADVSGLPEGGSEAARLVALALQERRPEAMILVRGDGPSWIVGDPSSN